MTTQNRQKSNAKKNKKTLSQLFMLFCFVHSVLASLNLPAALEDVGGDKVPQSVLDKAQQIKDMGGAQYLERLMTDMPELLTRNREILDEVSKTMDVG